MNTIIEALGTPLILLVLSYSIYWTMEWIKKVLPLKKEFLQPIALLIGGLLAGIIMFNYNYTPLDLGTSKFKIIEIGFQGVLLASLSGFIYSSLTNK